MRLREQYLRRFGLPVPLEVTVDEWTLDTDENRLIRAATASLLNLSGLPGPTVQGLRRLDRLLDDARLPTAGAPLAPWAPTRLNLRMHRLLHLADIALAHTSVELVTGTTTTHGFVVNMAWLFETLIARILKEHSHELAPQQVMPLDTFGRLTIKPDLVFYDQGHVSAVADTKYKLLDTTGRVPNADIYQLVTYCARLGLSEGHLIYASDRPPPEPFEIVGTDVRLVIHTIDLGQSLDEIERQVQGVAGQVRGLEEDAQERSSLVIA